MRGVTASSYSIRQTSVAFIKTKKTPNPPPKKQNLFVHVCFTYQLLFDCARDTSICVLFPFKDVFNEMLTCHLKEIKVPANFMLVAGMLL